MNSIGERIDKEFSIYLTSLKQLLQIKSVQGKETAEEPFGSGPKKALEEILKISEEWGFSTENIKNAIGYAEIKTKTDEETYVGILGHVDVVAEGTNWDYPPFELTIDGEKAFGRGVLDNKGPTLASLFALKLLKDEGKQFKNNVRVIFGTNEENGSKDLKYYLDRYSPPVYGFTPDSQFPAVYGEKAVISISLSQNIKEKTGIEQIEGEFTPSSVPDYIRILFSDKLVSEKFEGIRSPSNEPQLGKNAITLMADSLKADKRLSEEVQQFFYFIATVFHEKCHGEGLIPEDTLALWGIQITPYSFSLDNNTVTLEVTLRYNVDKSKDELLQAINDNLPESVQYNIIRYFPPKIFDREHFMVKHMKKVYEEATGLDGEPIITTGATYARFMPNIIAFGPSFPGQIGIAHNKNEYMYLRDLKKNIEIYYNLLNQLL